MGAVHLRAARPADAAACGAILQDWLDETPWMPDLHTLDETVGFCGRLIARAAVTVAEREAVCGFVARADAEIDALYVAADARGAGVGSQLLKREKAETETLTLWTFQANTGARAFYARHGFAELARTDGENDEGLPDVKLGWAR